MTKTDMAIAGITRPQLEAITEVRAKIRAKWHNRMTFDCFNAITDTGKRVICKKHVKLNNNSGDGSAFILQVLRGVTFTNCLDCAYYDDDGMQGG